MLDCCSTCMVKSTQSWDDEVAMIAQKWADKCDMKHEEKDTQRNIPGNNTKCVVIADNVYHTHLCLCVPVGACMCTRVSRVNRVENYIYKQSHIRSIYIRDKRERRGYFHHVQVVSVSDKILPWVLRTGGMLSRCGMTR